MQIIEQQIIGQYKILTKIGRGSTADVWSGEHLINKDKVALKIYSHAEHLEAISEELFTQEFITTKKLYHPNILNALDFFVVDHTPILVFDLCETSLEKEIGERKIIALENGIDTKALFTDHEIIDIVTQILHGLIFLHANGIIHNDIKPANIVMKRLASQKNQYFIIDFGISLDLKRITKNDQKNEIAKGKTVLYAAPEKLKGIDDEPKSDIFSLGVLVYELAGGKNTALLPGEIIDRGGKLKLDGRSEDDLVIRILEKCLHKNISNRPSPVQLLKFIQVNNKHRKFEHIKSRLYNCVKKIFSST